MLITIFNNHSQDIHNYQQKNVIILGVHNFSFFLTSFLHKKYIYILLQGQPIQLIQNVLWNQFYTHTLLKDLNKLLSPTSTPQNIYLKINTTTYRLSQCLQWEHLSKVKHELLKHPSIYIESFMEDGQTKVINIELSSSQMKKIDVVFEYQRERKEDSKLFKSVQKNNNISYISKTNNKSQTIKNQITTKSLLEIYKSKQKQDHITKYLTEKKRNQTKSKKLYKPQQLQHKNISQPKNPSSHPFQPLQYTSQLQQIETNSITHNITNNPMNKTQKTHIKQLTNPSKKQQLMTTILTKKQQKLRQCKETLLELQNQFLQKIDKIESTHQQQVITIKQQVQNILNTYKQKTKQLRKQNKSLLDQNHQLQTSNHHLQQTILIIKQNMKNLQQKQQNLQKTNHEYSIKLQNIQKNNSILNQQINQQILQYQLESNTKDKQLYHVKMKYQRLLGSLKYAAQTQKENIF